jgi:chromosome partitioning protein
MRRIAIINQKGGVGKTTTTANLGAALAIQGRRVVLVDMDAQANLSLALGVEARSGTPTTYSVLTGDETVEACLRPTKVPGLRLLPSNIDLSGAELELASAMGREYLLRDALKEWDAAHRKRHGRAAADYVLFDCPPSLGLLSINALAAAGEVLITLQTEFLALQGMSKLVEIVALLKKRLNPDLVVAGIVPTLYDIRLKLAREVLGEIRRYFKDQVLPHPIRANVKLAEAPSFAQTIFEYAPDSNGALDYVHLAHAIVAREARDADLAGLKPFDETARLPLAPTTITPRRMPPPRRKAADTLVAQPTRGTANGAARKLETHAVQPASVSPEKGGRKAQPKTPVTAPPMPGRAPIASATTARGTAERATAEPATAVRATTNSAAVQNTTAQKTTASSSTAPHTTPRSTTAQRKTTQGKTAQSNAPKSTAAQSTSSKSTTTQSTPAPSTSAPSAAAQSKTANGTTAKSTASKNATAKSTASHRSARKSATAEGPTPPAQRNGAQSRPAPDQHAPLAPPRTQAKTLKPVPRTVRADEVPHLPPDAFEILSTPLDP